MIYWVYDHIDSIVFELDWYTMEAELPALPLIPTLLLHKNESLTLNLIRLAKELRSSNKNGILFNLLLENQLHISKSKAFKKTKEKRSKNGLFVKD